ncbi:MAG: DUF3575 domain-containing protein [Bacteroidales bacterium]
MKKYSLLFVLGIFLINNCFSQMSFNKENSQKKSAFELTYINAKKFDNTLADKLAFISQTEFTNSRKRGSPEFNNSLKINPLSFIIAKFGLQYERKIADNMSLGLTLGLIYYSDNFMESESSLKGYSVNTEFRYYFEEAIEGLYISPYLTYLTLTKTSTDSYWYSYFPVVTKTTQTVFGGGMVAGRQWIWGGFTLDVFVGSAYTFTNNQEVDIRGIPISGLIPVIGVQFGYSF